MSLPEVILWQALRGERIASLRFRRQHPMGPYVADFYCPAARLVVEVDGQTHSHPDQASHDEARDRWMAAEGIRVLRVPAPYVLDDEALWGVLCEIEEIAGTAAMPPSPASPVLPPLRRGRSDRSDSPSSPKLG
ncbi:MAG TPA: endonuclease domain-containing protein, partial [Caulobacteraceae bacterium]|nr:endonuclease domain-containing protein [Caulobacteraceae bacterium]